MFRAKLRGAHRVAHYRRRGGAVADVAVGVRRTGFARRLVLADVHVLVLVLMVAEMLGSGLRLLMLAVRRSRSPDGLQRQQNEKDDGEPAAH